MTIPATASLFGLLLCSALLGFSSALGQTTTAHPPPPAAPPKAKAAQQPAKPPPVVQPKGPTHPQKPAAKPAPAAAPVPAPPPPVPEPPKQADADAAKGSNSGLPLPRFAALRSDEVNMRAGPGTRYPIQWVFKRRELPVQIQREFEVWRLIQDPEGVKGWVHQATLTGRRSFVITGADATLRRSADDGATAVAVLKPGVIGHLRTCAEASDWCQVQAGDYRGYLRRNQFWGTLPGEALPK